MESGNRLTAVAGGVKVDAAPLSTRVTLFSHASCARKLKCVLVVAVLVCARLLERKFPPSLLAFGLVGGVALPIFRFHYTSVVEGISSPATSADKKGTISQRKGKNNNHHDGPRCNLRGQQSGLSLMAHYPPHPPPPPTPTIFLC